jgi:hypothetical protein
MAYQVDEYHQVIDRFFRIFLDHEVLMQVMLQPKLIIIKKGRIFIKIINLLQQILQDVLEEIFHEHVDLIFFQIIMYIQHYQLVEYHDVFDEIHHKFLIRFFVFFSKIFNRFY